MTDKREKIADITSELKDQFYEREFYPVLEEEFFDMLATRRKSIEVGKWQEGRVLAVIGGSGSGKTTATDRLLAPYIKANEPTVDDAAQTVIQFNSPDRASGKDVAMAAITALGYTASPRREEGSLRVLLRGHLQQRETFVIHIDEAQDLVRYETRNERDRVIKLLKSLLVDKIWPVDVILSGVPELLETINGDRQLQRRATVIEVPQLHMTVDARNAVDLVADYALLGRVTVEPAISSAEFAERLMHAANREFGTMAVYIIGAIRRALLQDAVALSISHFATVYARKTNCPRTANPFLEKDFERIDVKAWLSSAGTQP